MQGYSRNILVSDMGVFLEDAFKESNVGYERLLILIGKHEALPVRAIPYVTGWYRFTPDVVAWYLAQDPARFTEWDTPLTAYRLHDGVPKAIDPREWNSVVTRLEGLDGETRARPEAQGYALWREQSASMLPSGVFVWLDEFEQIYRERCNRFQDKTIGKLILAPDLLDESTRAMVWEGFTRTEAPDDTLKEHKSSILDAPEDKPEKPWLVVNLQDPAAVQPWYTPARYFARQLVMETPTLLAKRDVLAEKVSTSLFGAGFKKRGGKLRFDQGTIKKALANTDLG